MMQIPLHSQVNVSLEYTPEIINELLRKKYSEHQRMSGCPQTA